MVDMNIPTNDAPAEQAPAVTPPTRTDDQFFHQANGCPSVRATTDFTASSTIPAIYIQQFWDTICFNSSTGLYSCQLDEQLFNLHKDILKDALDITPTNDNNPYVAPPSSDTVIEYVNTLGYPSTLRNVLALSVNALYQPWRAILPMINMCLTGKTARYDMPRHLEESYYGLRKKKKTTYLLIPSVRFTKLIIHHLKTKHNIHPRTGLTLHHSYEENILNTLMFVGKDGIEIFGMSIPDALLTDEIKGAPYYGKYQGHVAKYQQYLEAEHGKAEEGGATESPKATKVTKPKAAKATKPTGDKAPKHISTQPPKPKPAPTQPSKAIPEKKLKLVKETPDETSPAKRSKGGLVGKIRKPKSPLKLVDEPSAEDVSIEEPAYNKEERRTPMPTESSGHVESPSLDAELVLTDSETKSDNVVSKIDTRDQDEGQAGPNPGNHDEGQVGLNPGVQDEGQAELNPGDAAESQPQSSHVVYARPNLEHMDLEATDASTRQNPKQIDEEFTTTSYSKLHKTVLREEEPGKTNAEAEVQSMVSVPNHQDTSSVPLTTPVSKAVDEIVTDAVDWAMQAPLRARYNGLLAVDMKEILQQWMFEDKSYEAHEDYKNLYDALQKSLERDYSNQLLSDLEKARQKKRKRRDSPRTPSGSPPSQPPPPPPPAGASGAPGNEALSSSKSAASAPKSMAWTTSDTRYESVGISRTQELSFMDSLIQDDSILDEQATALVSAYETPVENSVLAKTGDMMNFLNWYCRQVNKTKLTQVDLKGQAYEVVKAFYPDVIHLYKGSSLALSISKMKAACYPEFGLELLVLEQMWIDDVCTYDISAKYGISHWWFNRYKFYIDRHASPSCRKEVRSHMWILNVVRIKPYSRYGYDYLSEIVLRRADLQEHTITEKDFKKLYPSDFEDLNLLLLQGHLDYLPGSDKRMLSTAVKLWTQNLVIRQRSRMDLPRDNPLVSVEVLRWRNHTRRAKPVWWRANGVAVWHPRHVRRRFVGKDGREIFGMPIPDALLTDEIKGAPYYGEYQEHVSKAFTASSIILAIHIQQFWDTMCFNSSTGLYICQLDEQWFNLHKDILRDALDITLTNDNNPFMSPPSSDIVIEDVNTLGYPSTLRNVSAMSVNSLYQPWKAILSMINMCLTGKTVGYDRTRHPVLQILWGIIHRSNIDYDERIWEEFVQSIQTFLTDMKNLATALREKKKTTHLLISSVRFTKLNIHHLKTKHNIHPRSGLPLHYPYDENVLNTLRFVGKDGREIF
nr:hypothetical protein [Tanacetum cinerariifolium]